MARAKTQLLWNFASIDQISPIISNVVLLREITSFSRRGYQIEIFVQ